MATFTTDPLPLPFFQKIFYLIAIGFCAVVGVIGLILPVIPGLLFLFFAAILLTRVSSRFHFLWQHYPKRKTLNRYWQSVKSLSATQRIKLSFWVFARSVVNGIEAVARLFRTNRVRD